MCGRSAAVAGSFQRPPYLWSPPDRAQQGRGRCRVCLGVRAVGTSSESRTAAAVQGAALAAQQRDGMACQPPLLPRLPLASSAQGMHSAQAMHS